ncbi:MAG: DUF401 family protein [Gudongella sp.]|nr:DUF401 family protein [Gudongella sp.]
MTQLLVTLASFGLIPIMIRKGFKLSHSILAVTLSISIFSGLGILRLGETFMGVILDQYSRDTILTVAVIGILGNLLKQYGILQRIVDSLLGLITSKKVIMMIIPSMIGIMSVPGGAVLSAPFINSIGDELDIIPARRAAINLIYRHIAMFLFPFVSVLMFVKAAIPQLNVYKVIGFGLPFIAGTVIIGYTLFMRGKGNGEKRERDLSLRKLLDLVLITSPIYMSVVINLITGLPFFVSMIGSIIIVYFLSDKKDFLYKSFNSINYNTIILVTAILVLKDIILQMDQMLGIINDLLMRSQGDIRIMLIFTLVSFFFGYITGYPTSALAVTLPLLSMMGLGSNALHIYTFFLLAVSFVGYFYSPLHLCQALTLNEMKVSTGELYKEYGPYFALQLLLVFATTLTLMAIFA